MRKLQQLQAAPNLDFLRVPLGNRLEALMTPPAWLWPTNHPDMHRNLALPLRALPMHNPESIPV